jgi:hypothetical protein
MLFDVFVHDAESLNGALHSARLSGKFAIVDAVRNGVVFPQKTETSDLLQNIAQRVRTAGFLFQHRNFVRQYITGVIDDISSSTCQLERTRVSIDLYSKTSEVALINLGEGICDRKYAAQALKRHRPEFQFSLDCALRKALDDDPSELIELAKKVLDECGGELREGFRQSISPNRMPLPVL